MKKFLGVLLNILFFTIILVIVVAISTIALTKKVNDFSDQYKNGFSASVLKHSIPIVSTTKGIVSEITLETGDEVSAGDTLVVLENPSLLSEINALKQFKDNVSAQTQAKLLEQQVDGLVVVSPSDGIVGDVNIVEGAPVEELGKLLTLYSNDDIRLLAQLTVDEYQAVRRAPKVHAYSKRLNQSFELKPDILDPDTKDPLKFEEKKIGLYFKFKNEDDAVSLLNNEDLIIQMEEVVQTKTNKPVDFIVNFWNTILPK